jgi:ParB family transcriptional regulator, chromosome partitioning protein
MSTRKVLGRGLGALIPSRTPEHQSHTAAAPPPAGLLHLELGKIVPNPHQPRKEFATDKLDELASSLASRGMIQPVIVRPLGDGRYELIAGERRWRAAGQAGLTRIPAVVRHAESAEALELALIENIQRQDLNPIETAKAYRHLAETFEFSHEEIAAKVGKDRTSITNLLRLLNLPEEIQKDLASGALSMGHARAILGVPDRAGQMGIRDAVLAKGLSVRETEALVKRLGRPKKNGEGKTAKKDIYINELENSIRAALSTKVTIRHHGKSGVIELHYYSVEELDRLANHLR